MALRVTGMNSGLDTESIIQELVSARKTKVDSQKKAQTKHQWKQDAWKDLNTKLKNLQTKYLSNMRFADAYSKKTTKVSNSSAVSVLTSEKAVNGVQSLTIAELAKTSYLTGGKLTSGDKGKVTALTKISDLTGAAIPEEGASLNLHIGDSQEGSDTAITITKDSTISDVLNQLKDKGLNASFDEGQQRLFVSAKESGVAGDFTISSMGDPSEQVLSALGLSVRGAGEEDESKATRIPGSDAKITLNGATFTSSSNSFAINGLTFTALTTTKPGEEITVTTEQDTDGIYDMVKNFLKEYNTLVNEMDKLYNADSAKGYEPLTDEEKDSMSETEVKDWEKKIKESLLRRDSNLSDINSALQTIMSSSIDVNGRKMSLDDFGISTLGYFNAAENEKHAYHIDGDSDDTNTSNNSDKLKAMISSDSDSVISFFTQLSRSLYNKMDNMSKAVKDYRTYGSFYDDKKMKADYDDYTSKISSMEKDLTAYEDRWYSKFSKMETALAKMQSNSSAVTSLLGG